MDSYSIRSSLSGKSRPLPEADKCSIFNYKDYLNFLDSVHYMEKSKPLYILYTSTKSPTSGYSWCPTCVEVDQIIEKSFSELQDSMFLSVHVGSEDEWEDRNNPFRTDKELNLRVIPTLLKYKTSKKLEGHYCLKPELLALLFEEECEV